MCPKTIRVIKIGWHIDRFVFFLPTNCKNIFTYFEEGAEKVYVFTVRNHFRNIFQPQYSYSLSFIGVFLISVILDNRLFNVFFKLFVKINNILRFKNSFAFEMVFNAVGM